MPVRSRNRLIIVIIILLVGIAQTALFAAPPQGLTMSRTWTELQSLVASDSVAFDQFGWNVVLDGDTLVVSTYLADINGNPDQGAVYVYRWNGTSWAETKLIASDGMPYDGFGERVALDGDTLVVGAYTADINENADQGAAYVYRWNGTSWVETKLTASDGAAGDNFGTSVTVNGETLVVSAMRADINENADQGAAYVYRWNGASWAETKLTASDAVAGDKFGTSVALDGDTLVVGAYTADINGNADQGAVYVYRWNETSWVETKLTASDGVAGVNFGASVALAPDILAVGVSSFDINGNADQGAAYVYRWNGTSWPETKLTASDGAAFDGFGKSVALDANTLVVGATGHNVAGRSNQGAAYAYTWNGISWVETKLTASDGEAFDNFGWSVTIDAMRVVVGAPYYEAVNGISDQGAVYLFTGNQAPLADAGPDQKVAVSVTVTLSATASFDPDDDALSYTWTQVSGTPVTLTNPLSATTMFSAPSGADVLIFELYVTDAFDASSTDTIEITVINHQIFLPMLTKVVQASRKIQR